MTSLKAVEKTLSELNLLGPDGWPAWTQVLQKAHRANYGRSDDPVYLHLASKTRLGAVTLQAVQFQDFLNEDGRYLLFQLSMTDQNLLSTIQSNQVGQLAWQMPKTREYFHLTGKFYICSAPRQVTRYSPPVLPHISGTTEDLAAQRQISNQFWEAKRLEQWRKLPPKIRASFTWPMTGSTPKGPATAFQCLAMEDMTQQDPAPGSRTNNRDSVMSQDSTQNPISSPSSPSSITSFRSRWNSVTGSITGAAADQDATPLSPVSASMNKIRNDNPAKILHDIAFDNFCLLVFKPLDIVHFESAPLPPKRTIYTTDAAGQWAMNEANP
ncbi:hypothetical protein BGZ80_009057 [Entomortierella chlamydospora]|uniref:Pyridoxamine 5'-phosphate oxidase Alr4036 family FMN-binding domain-containing protein n=1 Tax=Entomortierella chlamydospora TaxID=101097 RepID=A0A9P6T0R3_9FUNG|nr:hypothetical protein BGZ79_005521 [Entomortierella chlamydospora]KAG0016644.1 hypothetical protein BGZ80_009057 [Entomortierella chlamydospora]